MAELGDKMHMLLSKKAAIGHAGMSEEAVLCAWTVAMLAVTFGFL